MWRHLYPKVFRIGLLQGFGIVTVAVIALLAANTSLVLDRFYSSNPAVQQTVQGQIQTLNGNSIINFAIIVITWSGVGLIAYTVIWVGMLLLTEARNEIVVETEYVNRGPLQNRLRIPLLQIGTIILILLYLLLCLNNLYPLWAGTFAQTIWRLPNDITGAVGDLFVAVLGASVTLYGLKILISTLLNLE